MQLSPETLQFTLDATVNDSVLPGANASLFVDGRPTWTGTSGSLGQAPGDNLPSESPFPIYSITKTFTAACVLRMVDEHWVDLAAPLSTWLPEISFSEGVTLYHLLAHTSGIRDYGALPTYHEAVSSTPSAPWSFSEFVERTCARPLLFDPGEGWAYSNSGYTLLKKILELQTQGSFGDALARFVLDPLGLDQTFELVDASDMPRVVPGWSALFSDDGSLQDVRPTYHPGWCGTGVLASTGRDVCRFFDGLISGQLLSADSLAEMLRLRRVPGEHPPSVTPSYGLGIMADPDSLHGARFGHGGGGPGWNLYAVHIPDHAGRRLSLAVFCNHDGDHAETLADKLLAVM